MTGLNEATMASTSQVMGRARPSARASRAVGTTRARPLNTVMIPSVSVSARRCAPRRKLSQAVVSGRGAPDTPFVARYLIRGRGIWQARVYSTAVCRITRAGEPAATT